MTIIDEYGTIDQKKAAQAGYVVEDGDAWITKDVDVLIPAALEGQINGDNVKTDQPARQDRGRGRQRPHHPRSR